MMKGAVKAPNLILTAAFILGSHTNEGANFLMMLMMGVSIIGLLYGFLAGDAYLGVQMCFLVGVTGFTFLAFYAIKPNAIL